jgi:hypothetical protein
MLNTCFDFADVLLIGLGQTALAVAIAYAVACVLVRK